MKNVPYLHQLRVPQLLLSLTMLFFFTPWSCPQALVRVLSQSEQNVDCKCCQPFQSEGQASIVAFVTGRVNLSKDHEDPYPGQVCLLWESACLTACFQSGKAAAVLLLFKDRIQFFRKKNALKAIYRNF